jgi:hypothetical protein
LLARSILVHNIGGTISGEVDRVVVDGGGELGLVATLVVFWLELGGRQLESIVPLQQEGFGRQGRAGGTGRREQEQGWNLGSVKAGLRELGCHPPGEDPVPQLRRPGHERSGHGQDRVRRQAIERGEGSGSGKIVLAPRHDPPP